MMKPLHFLFSIKPKCPFLCELDLTYKKAISLLPETTRKEYCERLLNRTEFDLQNPIFIKDIEKLNILKKQQ